MVRTPRSRQFGDAPTTSITQGTLHPHDGRVVHLMGGHVGRRRAAATSFCRAAHAIRAVLRDSGRRSGAQDLEQLRLLLYHLALRLHDGAQHHMGTSAGSVGIVVGAAAAAGMLSSLPCSSTMPAPSSASSSSVACACLGE